MKTLSSDDPKQKKLSKKNILLIAAAIIGLIVIFLGIKWLTEWRYIVSTDDAYVEGDITSLSPRISGYVKKINIEPNQFVTQGSELFYIDDQDYKIAVEEAEARLETQKRTLNLLEEQIKAKQVAYDQAQAQRDGALAVKNNAESVLERTKKLSQNRYATQAQLESAQSSLDQASANLESAKSQIDGVDAEIKILKAQKAETESMTTGLMLAYDKAKNDLDSCIIKAPFDGVISNISAKEGDLISNGQRLAALVPVHKLYIVANLKETQLSDVRKGQTASFKLDAIKNQTFQGKVLSISPATGSIFSLLPPQNATGNFTKVIQRIPVRISIPKEALAQGNIRAGLSAIVDIDTRTTPKIIENKNTTTTKTIQKTTEEKIEDKTPKPLESE